MTNATKLRHGDANTMMAEGGIQVADQPGKDSPYYHYLDMIGGGHYANVPELVYTLVTQAPSVLQWLESLGVMFDKNPDGSFKVLHLGGTCRKRVHVAADITGAEIMRTIRDEARNRKGISVLEFSPAAPSSRERRSSRPSSAGPPVANWATQPSSQPPPSISRRVPRTT